MKNRICFYRLAVVAFLGVTMPQTGNAQGTLFLSHLGSSADTGLGVGNDAWYAVDFETGTAVSGYRLDSIQLRLADVSGSPSGFSLSVYSNNGGLPGSSLEPLAGFDPTGAGIYTFTSSGLSLTPSTVYWAVATSASSSSSGNSFFWAFDPSSYTSSDGWSMDTIGNFYSWDGSTWNSGGGSPFTLAVDATVAPEPGICSLVALGLMFICLQTKCRA